jgi:hypothetical protein
MSLDHQIALPPKRSGGLDGRSRGARRLKRLVATYSKELGHDLTDLQRQSIVRAARLTVVAEDLQHRQLAGEAIDIDLLVRADSTQQFAQRVGQRDQLGRVGSGAAGGFEFVRWPQSQIPNSAPCGQSGRQAMREGQRQCRSGFALPGLTPRRAQSRASLSSRPADGGNQSFSSSPYLALMNSLKVRPHRQSCLRTNATNT